VCAAKSDGMNVSIRYKELLLGNLLENVNNQPFFDFVDSQLATVLSLQSTCRGILSNQAPCIGTKARDLITLLETNLTALALHLEAFKEAAKDTAYIDTRGAWSSWRHLLAICARKVQPSITELHAFALKPEISIFERVEIELVEFNFLKLAKYAAFFLHLAGIVELMHAAQFSGQIDPGRMHLIAFTCKVPPFWYELEENNLRCDFSLSLFFPFSFLSLVVYFVMQWI
jgi:hypothetical protein